MRIRTHRMLARCAGKIIADAVEFAPIEIPLDFSESRGHILQKSRTRFHNILGSFPATNRASGHVSSNSTGQRSDELFLEFASDKRTTDATKYRAAECVPARLFGDIIDLALSWTKVFLV